MYGVFLQGIYINVIDGLAFNFLYFVFIIIITFWNLLYVQPILSSQLQNKNKNKNPSFTKSIKIYLVEGIIIIIGFLENVLHLNNIMI